MYNAYKEQIVKIKTQISCEKSMEKIYHVNTKQDKSGVVIPIVHKVDFRAKKKVTGDRGHNHFKHLQTPVIEPRYT